MSACTRSQTLPGRILRVRTLEEYVNDGGGLAIVPPRRRWPRRPQAAGTTPWIRTTCCPPGWRDLTSVPEGKRCLLGRIQGRPPPDTTVLRLEARRQPGLRRREVEAVRQALLGGRAGRGQVVGDIHLRRRPPLARPGGAEARRGGQGREARPRAALHHAAQPPAGRPIRSGLEQFLRRLLRHGPHQRGGQVPGRRLVGGEPELRVRRPGRAAAAGDGPARRLPAERRPTRT